MFIFAATNKNGSGRMSVCLSSRIQPLGYIQALSRRDLSGALPGEPVEGWRVQDAGPVSILAVVESQPGKEGSKARGVTGGQTGDPWVGGQEVRTEVRELESGRRGQSQKHRTKAPELTWSQLGSQVLGVGGPSDKDSAFWRWRKGRPVLRVCVSRPDKEGLHS